MNGLLKRALVLCGVLVIGAFLVFQSLSDPVSADTTGGVWIRYNQIGYPAGGQQRIVVVWANNTLDGKTWRIGSLANGNFSNASNANARLKAGDFSGFQHSDGNFLPGNQGLRYKEIAFDLTCTSNTPCNHTFTIDGIAGANVNFKVYRKGTYPYDQLIDEVLRHFRAHRSGVDQTTEFQLKAGHTNDNKCQVFTTSLTGNVGNHMLWQPLNTAHNMSGGWYDAGDYLKFTHTIAYSTYVMLRAVALRRARRLSNDTVLPALENEARIGLDYLMRTVPNGDPRFFVIQVGDGRDHKISQADRPLPENDNRPLERRCYAAFSAPQMAYTAAALKLGAKIFGNNSSMSNRANIIFNLARNRNNNNRKTYLEFYGDDNSADNLRLAEAEITGNLSGDPEVELHSVDYQTSEILAYLTLPGNIRVKDGNLNSAIQARVRRLVEKSDAAGDVWKIPASTRVVINTNVDNKIVQKVISSDGQRIYPLLGPAFVSMRRGTNPNERAVAYNVLNYLFGLNNWDLSLMRTSLCTQCNNTITYDAIYRLSNRVNGMGEIYQGGIDVGKDECTTNNDANKCERSPFSTNSVNFHFKEFNFQTIETSIWGESLAILLFVAMDEDDGPPP